MLRASLAVSRNRYTAPILRGEVAVEGVQVEAVAVHPSEMFWRQLKFREFDISEMSLASLFMLHAAGDTSWAALPIFTSRRFFHTGILVGHDSGILRPQDLAGRIVGVPEYQQTAAVWCRGVLADDFGVRPDEMSWIMERQPDRSHGSATGFSPPEGLTFSYGPTDVTTAQMLAAGDLDALLIHLPERNLIDRGSAGVPMRRVARPLFEDRRAETARFFRAHGYVPANHCVVVRRELVESHPWLTSAVYELFESARESADRDAYLIASDWADRGLIDVGVLSQLRQADSHYSLDPPDMLTTLARHCHEQGLTDRVVDVSAVFEPQFRPIP